MSKKKEIIELLEKDTDVEEICSLLEVSTSYVYRIKREMDESAGDSNQTTKTQDSNSDGVVIDSTGGDSSDVEGNKSNMETEEREKSPDQTNKMGGVKKRKKTKKNSTVQKNTEQTEQKKGIKSWIMNQKKKMLLILTSLILLGITLLSFSKMHQRTEKTTPREPASRYPILR